ncbi:MAG: hypothetical protein IRZ28_22555 [Steroidobacteraceae bacterium]|nr:hypothetical protein [Steroidobacteraceae bacterium]
MRAAILGLMLALAGCASDAEIAAGDRAKCQSYGFQPGTDGFANCLMRRESARWDAIAQGFQSVPAPRQTYCNTIGGVTSCSTH